MNQNTKPSTQPDRQPPERRRAEGTSAGSPRPGATEHRPVRPGDPVKHPANAQDRIAAASRDRQHPATSTSRDRQHPATAGHSGTVRNNVGHSSVRRPSVAPPQTRHAASPPLFDGSRKAMMAVLALAAVVFLALIITLIACRNVIFAPAEPSWNGGEIPTAPMETGPTIATEGTHPFADGATGNALAPFASGCAIIGQDQLSATRAVLMDVSTGEIIASRLGDEKMFPASMTKVMTLIVVAENLAEDSSLYDRITISQDVYDAMAKEGGSGVGLAPGEQVTVEALIYMLMLRSDCIAACELARYIAGSEAAFVALMNHKAASMGLTNTHFANPTGLHDEGNYTTCREMASIMAYAMKMSLCRKVLTAVRYDAPCVVVSGKNQGQTFTYYVYHNLLVSMLSDKYPSLRPKNVTVVAGKTGYAGAVSGYCLVTYAITADDKAYICVTSASAGYQDCIKDYITIYDRYVKN